MTAWDTFPKAVPENVNDEIEIKGSHGIRPSNLGFSRQFVFNI